MIKVEHTKTIPHPNHFVVIDENILVTETKLILVECKREESCLYIHEGFPTIHPYFPKDQGPIKGIGKYYKPILISENNEKIEVGDWFYDSLVKHCRTYQGVEDNISLPNKYCFKILALPEHFSPQQLQMIVDSKLKDGDKVLVECEKWFDQDAEIGDDWGNKSIKNKIKLNPHITIYPVEKKMYTREEVINFSRIVHFRLGGRKDDFDNYIKENLK